MTAQSAEVPSGATTTADDRSGRSPGGGLRRNAPSRRTVAWLARGGLVARGIVYGIVGVLALKLALGSGGKATTQQGALQTLNHEPLGNALLLAVAVGLGAYALWRAAEGLFGTDPGADKATLHRVSAIGGAIAYAVLCASAIRILAGGHASGGSSTSRHAAAGVLGWPGGPVIVAIVGLVIIGIGLYQGYKGVSRSFLEDSRTASMSERTRRSFTALGVFGHLARAVTFAIVGFGVTKAAVDYSPRSAIGLDGALRHLQHDTFGPLLLGLVALGFVGFGLYSVVDARYHRV